MIKRGDWASRTTYSDRDAAFDPASERSAGMMLGAFRSRWEDTGPAPFGPQFAGGDEVAFARASSPSHARELSVAQANFPAVFDLFFINRNVGFTIEGGAENDRSGSSVSSAGDVNGDGFADIIINAPLADPGGVDNAGASYVIFGKAGGFGNNFYVDDLDGSNGFRFDGGKVNDGGFSISSAGDVNGDGFDDLILGEASADLEGRASAGESYVVFGKADGFAASIDVTTLDGTAGFRLVGIDAFDLSGGSVSSAGDVNGDGFDDIIIGARGADPGGVGKAGESYVVFGKADGFGATLNLRSLDGTNGFRIDGIDRLDYSGAVSSAGDVNGDGFDDILIGASGGDPGGDLSAGESYVVFGKASAFAASIDLATLDGVNGFRIEGIDASDGSGRVFDAGDVNGDGFDDIIIGASGGDPDGRTDAGESYVVFGQADGFAASIDLSTLDGSNGFRIDGVEAGDRSGSSVSSAGDVNGDGFDDIIIGAPSADTIGFDSNRFRSGESYVVFGKAGGFAPSLELATLDGTNGFIIEGAARYDGSGGSVSGAGDINGDGFDDILIGARYAYAPPSGDGAGETYVLYGRAPTEAVTRVGSAAGQTIRGGDFDDTLDGKGGKDTLAGGKGLDTLTGGAGADDFLLASRRAADADTILDFGGTDRIALDGDVYRLREGDLAASRFVIGDTAADASDRLIYDDATGRLFFDADGTGAKAQVLIATLTDAPPLAASDFIVI